MAAGAITVTKTDINGYFKRWSIAWVSDASGAVNGNATPDSIIGTIVCVEFKPDAAGTQPSDQYDMTITNTSGIDILAGQGANLSNATATAIVPGVPFKDGTTTSTAPRVVADPLTPVITNAGNAKGGTIIIYTR